MRQNKLGDPIDRRCGEIVRKIWFYMEQRAWTGVPSRIVISQFPDYASYREKLENEFGVKGDLFTVYLKYPYKVEVETAAYIANLAKSEYDGKTIFGDPNFLRKNLSPDQKEAIAGALTNPVSIITGIGGTGKTSVIAEIIHNLELREIPYVVVSFTGKAVARIREVIQRKHPSTMHRLIARAGSCPPFRHLIIDEASMITTSLFHKFVRTFSEPYAITFVGDCNQLQPIEWGALFEQLIATKRVPIYTLTTIHRIRGGEGDGIGINSRRIIEYGKPKETDDDDEEYYNSDDENGGYRGPFDFTETANFTLTQGNREAVYDIVQALFKAGVNASQITIVTPYNREVDELNQMFQQIFHDEKPFIVDPKGKIWKLGDRVMMLENNYDINVMNGEEGFITEIKEGEGIVVSFKDNATHLFHLFTDENEPSEDAKYERNLTVNMICHSYAITIHRSQGSEWDFVILYIPATTTETSFLSRNMIYTAISRGKRAVWCVGDIDTLRTAAQRAPSYRCDNLAQRITTLLPQ